MGKSTGGGLRKGSRRSRAIPLLLARVEALGLEAARLRLLLEGSSSSGGGVSPPAAASLRRLAVLTVGSSEYHHRLISVDEIVYFFLGRVIGNRRDRALLEAPWTRLHTLRPERVYARTAKGGLYLTHFRSLAALRKRLSPYFVLLSQSILANLPRISEPDLEGRLKRFGVRFSDGSTTWVEWLTVSRRRVPALRVELGIPRKLRGRSSAQSRVRVSPAARSSTPELSGSRG